ncbi:MAG: hypothetical protein HFF13_09065 [Angelakisella sp.]|jgi:hypothetical protein|nr:hypothetical protein [Angelakisella sp.]
MEYIMSEERRKMLEEAVASAEPYPEELFEDVDLDGPPNGWDIDPKRMLATLAKRELEGSVPVPIQYRISVPKTT